MPRTHAECDVRLGRGARFGQEPSLRECKHAPVGEVVGDRSRRDRRLRVFQRLQAAEDVASQERDPAENGERVDDRGVGARPREEHAGGVQVGVGTVEPAAVEVEQSSVEEQARLPDHVTVAAKQAQGACRVADDAPVRIGIGAARSAVDVDPVHLGLSAVAPREQPDRRRDLALSGSQVAVFGELKGEMAAKQPGAPPIAVALREPDPGLQGLPGVGVAENVLRPAERITREDLGLDVSVRCRGGQCALGQRLRLPGANLDERMSVLGPRQSRSRAAPRLAGHCLPLVSGSTKPPHPRVEQGRLTPTKERR